MHGHRIHRWGSDPEWDEFSVPEPGPGEVLVRVASCGVGLTVLNYSAGTHQSDPGLLPRVPGHEISGTIVAAGAGVDPGRVGERVFAYFYLFCGVCPECREGMEPRCSDLGGWVGIQRDGGYAEYTVLPAANLIPIPEGLDPIEATVVPDAVATSLHVCRERAGVSAGDRVVVVGAGGGVGVHLVQMALLFGAEVLAVEAADSKLEPLAGLGCIPIAWRDAVRGELPGRTADVVIDLVGSSETLRWSVENLGMGGRMVVVTGFPDERFSLDGRDLVFREAAILGSRYASVTEAAEAARMVAAGDIRPVIGETLPARGVLAIHDRLRAGSLLGRGAIVW